MREEAEGYREERDALLTGEDHENMTRSLMREQSQSVDMVILDITMPGIDGIETRARLRQRHPTLPIMLSSGYPEDALETLRSGDPTRDGFIQKPYTSAARLRQIAHMLKK